MGTVANLTALAQDVQSSCDTGMVSVIKSIAPLCINSCSEVCPALEQAVNSYMGGGDFVCDLCQHKESVKCLVQGNNAATCKGLLDKAESDMGFVVPRSAAKVDDECASKCPHQSGATTIAYSTIDDTTTTAIANTE